MLVFLSPAKTFTPPRRIKSEELPATRPLFYDEAQLLAASAASLTADRLAAGMQISPNLAASACRLLQEFPGESTPAAPAALVYSGMVFKKLDAAGFGRDEWIYAQEHLLLASFIYGLLKPSDLIRPYRMEGNLLLPEPIGKTPFDYWKDKMTDIFIERIRIAGGVLCDLASEEMKNLFHWHKIKKAVHIVQPLFLVRRPDGRTKQIVIYTKMARGFMARNIIKNRIEDVEVLKRMTPNGFVYSEADSSPDIFRFILED
ncbi:Protein of uncharacterised function (DUF328) [Porphyromonas macacae]|uniref:UPF0246 protein NCTC11632_00597 n=1 Tax=Porphyromonas macacae TaxID=28115 RepID=A0A379E785_9PORP|nr:YaaA family protein [Porphyromonas macacae]SUB88526.1 Protein of uncharacterised function (DUF328) [Porphyromonas macacae]